MPAGFGLSVVDIDLGKAAPLAVLAGVAFGLWYVWNKQKQFDAQNTGANAGNTLAHYQQASDDALLHSLTGGPANAATSSATPTANPALPAYSAPGSSVQNYTNAASGSATLGAGFATSNGI